MNFYLLGCRSGVALSLLNICAVFFVLLLNVRLNAAKTAWRSGRNKLIFVAMVHRHGDRNPTSLYPTDPYSDYPWPGGLGALTQTGARQLYNLGTHIRARYESLKPWNGIYTAETVHAISSSPERTRMSGESMLASFWRPYECENSLPIPWQPVPLAVIPAAVDYILYQADSKCPKYDQIYNKYLTDPDPKSSLYRFNRQKADLFKYLSEYMGENVTNVVQAGNLYDTLFAESSHGLELPAWTDKVYPNPLYAARVRQFQLFTETDYMKLIRGGPLVTDIHGKMAAFHNRSSAINLITYSGHDTVISNVLRSMQIVGQTDPLPSYGALLAFELHENRHRENTVQMVYYNDTTTKTPQILEIPGCPHPCIFGDFTNTIKHLLISNYTQACAL